MLYDLFIKFRDMNLELSDLRTMIMRFDEMMQQEGVKFFSEEFEKDLSELDKSYEKAECLGERFFNKYQGLISKYE